MLIANHRCLFSADASPRENKISPGPFNLLGQAPALVRMHKGAEPLRDGTKRGSNEMCAVPGGLVIHHNAFPGLTSWATFVARFALRITNFVLLMANDYV